jgi:DNA-binding transcriptional LysR family regulator
VSARIASIEAQTGVQLVTRTARGSALTPAGTSVAEWADRLLHSAAELDAGLAALRGDQQTRLRVSASLTIAEQLLPRWLVSLQAAGRGTGRDSAEVTLTATNSDRVIEQVRAGEADLGFIEGPRVPKDLHSRVVAHDQLLVVVRPDHPWVRRRRPVDAAELNDTPLISREEGSGTRDALAHALRRALGPQARQSAPIMSLSTTSAVRAGVLAGAGPAVLSELAVTDDLASGRLTAIPVIGIDLRRALRAVWVGPRTPPAGAVRDLLSHIHATHH